MIKNWIKKYNLHHKFRVWSLLLGLGGYSLSLALWWTFMNLRVFAPPSAYVTIIEWHPVASSAVLLLTTFLFNRLKTFYLFVLLLFPFALLALAVANAYTPF